MRRMIRVDPLSLDLVDSDDIEDANLNFAAVRVVIDRDGTLSLEGVMATLLNADPTSADLRCVLSVSGLFSGYETLVDFHEEVWKILKDVPNPLKEVLRTHLNDLILTYAKI